MPILKSVNSLRTILKKENPSSVIIVSSKAVIEKLNWAIKEMGLSRFNIIEIPDGEAAKEWPEAEKIIKKFTDYNLDRNGLVIALGGGTVGDVVGFVASIYLRGVKYVQIPTTLLAQVDSAHGGKTAVDFLGYKNQVGTFYLPIATIIDSRFMKSLPEEQIINGLGEIIKSGLIKDSSILSLLKNETVSGLSESKKLESIIEKTIKAKQYYVNKDYKDIGVRQILNFGHTLGHSIELKYGVGHGRAVIMGMLQELKIAEKLKLTPPSVRDCLETTLESLGIKIDDQMKAEYESILHDKKVDGGQIFLPVISKVGKSRLVKLNIHKIKTIMPTLVS